MNTGLDRHPTDCSGTPEINQAGVVVGNGFAQADNTIAGGYPLIVMEEQFRIIRGTLSRQGLDECPVGASVGQNQFATLASSSCVNSRSGF